MVPRGKQQEPELVSDAWARFERAVNVVAKSPPRHRTKKKRTRKKAKSRALLLPQSQKGAPRGA